MEVASLDCRHLELGQIGPDLSPTKASPNRSFSFLHALDNTDPLGPFAPLLWDAIAAADDDGEPHADLEVGTLWHESGEGDTAAYIGRQAFQRVTYLPTIPPIAPLASEDSEEHERLDFEQVRRDEARIESDLAVIRKDKCEVDEEIAATMREASRLIGVHHPSVAIALDESIATEKASEALLALLESEAAGAVTDALEVASERSWSLPTFGSTTPPPLDTVGWHDGLCEAHGFIVRRWKRHRVEKARLQREIEETWLAVQELEVSSLSRAESGDAPRLRAELDQAREASAAVWNVAENIGGEASQNEMLRRRCVEVRKDQQLALASSKRECDVNSLELNAVSAAAQEFEWKRRHELNNLRERAVRLRIAHQTAFAELKMEEHGDRARYEASVSTEQSLRSEMVVERDRTLQLLKSLKVQGASLREIYEDSLKELRTEESAIYFQKKALLCAERKMHEQRQEQQYMRKRLQDFSIDIHEFEQAQREKQRDLRLNFDEAKVEAEGQASVERNLCLEFASLNTSVGGRSPAQVEHCLAELHRQVSQSVDAEEQQKQYARGLLEELQTTQLLAKAHDISLERHELDKCRAFLNTEHKLHSALINERDCLNSAREERENALQDALYTQNDFCRRFRVDLAALRDDPVASEKHWSKMQRLQTKMHSERMYEMETLEQYSSHAKASTKVLHDARTDWKTFLRLGGASRSLPMVESIGIARFDTFEATSARAELTAALRSVRLETAELVVAPLGRLLRRKVALACEGAALAQDSASTLPSVLKRVDYERAESRRRRLVEMKAAAARVERLRHTLHFEITALRGSQNNSARGIPDTFLKDLTPLAGEARRVRDTAHAEQERERMEVVADERELFGEELMMKARDDAECRFWSEVESLGRVTTLCNEEGQRAIELSSEVTAHMDILQPTRALKLDCLLDEVRHTEIYLRTEIAGERQIGQELSLHNISRRQELVALTSSALEARQRQSVLSWHLSELREASDAQEAKYNADIAEARERLGEKLNEASIIEGQLRQDAERKRLELQHLSELGSAMEHAIGHRLALRAASGREELQVLSSEVAMSSRNCSSFVEQLRNEGQYLRDALSELRGEQQLREEELIHARCFHSRWCLPCTPLELAPEPSHQEVVNELKESFKCFLIAHTDALAKVKHEGDSLCSEMRQKAVALSSQEHAKWENEVLATSNAALAETQRSISEERLRWEPAATRAKRSLEESARLRTRLAQEESTCFAMLEEVKADEVSAAALRTEIEEEIEVERWKAEVELHELRECLVLLRGTAQEEDISRSEELKDAVGNEGNEALEGLLGRLDEATRDVAKWQVTFKRANAVREIGQKTLRSETSAAREELYQLRNEMGRPLDQQRRSSEARTKTANDPKTATLTRGVEKGMTESAEMEFAGHQSGDLDSGIDYARSPLQRHPQDHRKCHAEAMWRLVSARERSVHEVRRAKRIEQNVSKQLNFALQRLLPQAPLCLVASALGTDNSYGASPQLSELASRLCLEWRNAMMRRKIATEFQLATISCAVQDVGGVGDDCAEEAGSLRMRLEEARRSQQEQLQSSCNEYASRTRHLQAHDMVSHAALAEELQRESLLEVEAATLVTELFGLKDDSRDNELVKVYQAEWNAEREVLESLLRSWRRGADEARRHASASALRETKLHRRMAVADQRHHQYQCELEVVQSQLRCARENIKRREVMLGSMADDERQNQMARELRHAKLQDELRSLFQALCSLQGKHSRAVYLLRELEGGLEYAKVVECGPTLSSRDDGQGSEDGVMKRLAFDRNEI